MRASSLGNLSRISLSNINMGMTGCSPFKAWWRPTLSSSRKSLLNQKMEIFSFIYEMFKVDIPPSTPRTCPVTQVLWSLKRKWAKLAISAASPTRFSGWRSAMASRFLSLFNKRFASGVSTKLGAMQLTRTFGAYSAAKERAKPSIAPFAAATLV